MFRQRTLTTVIIFVVILALGLFGYSPLLKRLNLGLDLRGGVHVVLEARDDPTNPVTDEKMNHLKTVMQRRVDELGVSEPVIQREGKDRLIVELAGLTDPEKAVEVIGRTAQLAFKTHDGKVVLTGEQLKDARPARHPDTGAPEVHLSFNDEGTKAFASVTTELSRNYPEGDPRRRIAIYLDDELLTNPEVKEPIPTGEARITGGFASFEDAANIAALLKAGALPVPTDIVEKRLIGPSLGLDSLAKSKQAVIIGLAGIALYMLIMYRLPGLVACFSLIIYGLIVVGVLAALKATLTLPGIAGLLLSVGVAVDANILIYERLREELRSGKSLRASVEAGFKHAFRTIVDANVTTLIAAFVLLYYGIGPVKGFAVTLSLGILASMFTAISLTRFLLGSLISLEIFRNPKLYGA